MSKALEAAEAAILDIMGPVVAHPEASEDVIARMKARQVKAAKNFSRAAILAFLREAAEAEDRLYHADEKYERLSQHTLAALARLAEGD